MTPGLNLHGRIDLAGAKLSRADSRDWLARAAVWFETVGDAVLDTELVRHADDRSELLVSFHPAADPVEVRVASSGAVGIRAITGPAGPGYHAHLAGVLDAFADDFDVPLDKIDDPTGFYRSPDLEALNRYFLDDLRKKCHLLNATAADWTGTPMPLGLPADHGYTHPGPVLTVTGPRTREWLAAVADDRRDGRDAFPWWNADLDAAFYRNRALGLMWNEFPWRAPLTDDEGELTDQIAADLATAYTLDPNAAMPWREWAEVIAAMDVDDHELTVEPIDPALRAEVLKRAAESPDAKVGYRRYPVRIPLGLGWSVEVPGTFADQWSDDGRTWQGWDKTRRITAGFGKQPEMIGLIRSQGGLWLTVAGDTEFADSIWANVRREPGNEAVAG